MTEQKTPEQWKAEREARQKALLDSFENLTEEQQQAIRQMQDAARRCLNMIDECHDLYLSDIDKLSSAFWGMHHQFPAKDA